MKITTLEEIREMDRILAEKEANRAANDQIAINAMNEQIIVLQAQLPANHILVNVTDLGNSILQYDVGGFIIHWSSINHIGIACAIRTGAIGAFQTVYVCSIDRNELAALKGETVAETVAETVEVEIPATAINAYNQYQGSADKAWEAEDETAWATIRKWSGRIEIQRRAEEIASKLRESKDWNIFDCMDLCDLSGMHDEWMNTSPFDEEAGKQIMFKAAKTLNVKI